MACVFFFFQAEDGIRDLVRSRGLGDVYKRQLKDIGLIMKEVVPQTKGKADGNLVAKIVKESLI